MTGRQRGNRSGSDADAAGLERRYRRLLRCYPAEHRAAYAEEMIGVLMSASAPGQRRPDREEAVNLVVFGLRARLRAPLRAARTPAWRDAANVFGHLVSVAFAAMFLHEIVSDLAMRIPHIQPYRSPVVLAVAWAIVAVVTRLGRPRVAAVAATAAALVQALVIVHEGGDPGLLVTSWWRLVLAVTVAASLVAPVRRPVPEKSSGSARPDAESGQPGGPAEPVESARLAGLPRFPGVRLTTAIVAAAALFCAAPLLEIRTVLMTAIGPDGQGQVYRIPETRPEMAVFDGRPVGPATVVGAVLLAAVLAVAVLRQAPPIRRRVLLLAVPTAATALLVTETFGGFLASAARFPALGMLAPQWAGLVATPILAFAIGAWWHARYERKLASGSLLA